MLQDFIKLTKSKQKKHIKLIIYIYIYIYIYKPHIAEDFIVKELTLIMASFIKMLMDFIVPLHEFIKIKDFTLIK